MKGLLRFVGFSDLRYQEHSFCQSFHFDAGECDQGDFASRSQFVIRVEVDTQGKTLSLDEVQELFAPLRRAVLKKALCKAEDPDATEGTGCISLRLGLNDLQSHADHDLVLRTPGAIYPTPSRSHCFW